MKKKLLGNTGEFISSMGLGTMYFGSKVSREISFEILDYYREQGGSLLDSANKYASWVNGCSGGESERVIGEWMRERSNRNELFITSKVGLAYGKIPATLKKDIIISECEKSLKRMGIQTIDLYFAHASDADTPLEETMEALFHLRKEGKIRYAGASNFYAWELSEANSNAFQNSWEGFVCLQQRHTYLEPVIRADFGIQKVLTPAIEEYCEKHAITMMAYSPLLGGAYVKTDKPLSKYYQSFANEVRMERLKQLAKKLDVTINKVVLSWMMNDQPGIIPLVSGSSLEQIKENLEASKIELQEENLKLLNSSVDPPNKY